MVRRVIMIYFFFFFFTSRVEQKHIRVRYEVGPRVSGTCVGPTTVQPTSRKITAKRSQTLRNKMPRSLGLRTNCENRKDQQTTTVELSETFSTRVELVGRRHFTVSFKVNRRYFFFLLENPVSTLLQ